MSLSQNVLLLFHDLSLDQSYQEEKQGVDQYTIHARQLESVKQARQAAAFLPAGDHPRALEVQDSGDILLLQPYGFSVFPQVIRNLLMFDFSHTLLD
jgi:hypothetical protein